MVYANVPFNLPSMTAVQVKSGAGLPTWTDDILAAG